ncbi:chorismate mutase [Enterococcus sp. JM9B]|uniref:chorismate mutase n=1 Tax=Enterococcus sp. JM9B TaxID=1857216 RepID=UPI00137532D0|nr:chorismate mutase [Enterococcus sp. JM9B]KAF1300939.1 chorismate mutase [Enterococcus sp. JM9B]
MKTEKEKMIAGELYFAEDPVLVAERKHSREQMHLINHELDGDIRSQLLKETFGHVAGKIYMEPTVAFDYGYNISVGKNFYANFNCTLLDICPITIGDACMIGPNVQLLTATHPLEPVKRNSGLESGKPITLGNNVWLGGGVVIIPGVTLGDNVVVAAGSVVTKSFGDNVVLGGNPAKVIKRIETEKTEEPLTIQRKKIDTLDRKIAQLLEERMDAVAEIGAIKKQTNTNVLDSKREEKVLDNVRQAVNNPAYRETIQHSFEDIMKHSRAYQAQIKGAE